MRVVGYQDSEQDDYPKPRKVQVMIDSISVENFNQDDGDLVDTVLDSIKRQKAKHSRSFAELRLRVEYSEGDENTLSRNHLVLYGTRLETDQEVKSRLQHWANRFLMDSLTHHRMVKGYEKNLKDMMKKARKHASEVCLFRHDKDMLDLGIRPPS